MPGVRGLEDQLHPELQNARIVSTRHGQECVPTRYAARIARRAIGAGITACVVIKRRSIECG